MREGVTQFASLMNGARGFGGDVARDAAGEAKLLEQSLQAALVPGNVRIYLSIGALQVSIGYDSRAAMPRAGEVQHVQILFADHAVEMNVNKVQTRGGPPVPQQSGFDVLAPQRPLQQRIVQ